MINYDNLFQNIVSKGRKYTSSNECYSENVEVMCDRCKTTEITEFMHLGEHDLCNRCVEDIEKWNTTQNFEELTLMAQDQFHPKSENRSKLTICEALAAPLTKMVQDQFHRRKRTQKSKMEQSLFKPMMAQNQFNVDKKTSSSHQNFLPEYFPDITTAQNYPKSDVTFSRPKRTSRMNQNLFASRMNQNLFNKS